MTIEKAIEQLEDLIKDRESFCHHDDFDEVFLQDIEALKVGISALEKQLPKKVIKRCSTDKLFASHQCPVCKKMPMYRGYCYNCGQALDWSDENA